MLDIRLLRDQPDLVKERLAGRDPVWAASIDEVLACDMERRRLETETQRLQAERKSTSKEIGVRKKQGEDTSEVEATVRGIGDQINELGRQATEAEEKQRQLLLGIPNLPHPDCPVGQDENANPEIKQWGEKPSFDFEPVDHVELAHRLGLIDFERGAKVAGSGFLVLTGPGARLQRAALNFMLNLQSDEHGYTEINPPYLIRRECMTGTGQLPKFEDDMYGLEENQMFLAPTAEVPVTNLRREELLAHTELPVAYAAYSPCFRREAGSAGKVSRGMIRVHQFDKVEMVRITRAEDSYQQLEQMLTHAETVLQRLGLHYRVIELCTGDLGFGAAKTYDIEVWAPGHGGYLEVSSVSNFEDYQARRMQLRYKDAEGKNRMCHTLNGSGLAMPRLFVALIESGQQPDGSVRLPEPLHAAMGCECLTPVQG